jgi:hypothetical protein
MPAGVARLSVLWLVTSAVAACSSDAGAPPAPAWLYQSGTRLRARVTDAGGGARRFDGWYDTQLATPCTFRRAADGVQRCVPMAQIIYGPTFYLDAACSVPATDYVDPEAEAPFFATNGPLVPAPPAACGADLIAASTYDEYAVEAWRVGPAQPTTGAFFYRNDSGGCSQFPMSVSPVYPLEPLAAAQLVGATATVETRGPSMAVKILTADDGAKAVGEAFDTTLGRPCFPSWVYFVTNDYRCWAATARTPNETPQGCGSGAVAACADEIFVDGSVCGPSFHTLAAAPCGPPGGDGFDFYELGAPFDPARFPSLTSELVGTGRLRLVIARPSDDDRPLFVNPPFFASQDRYIPGSFFDTERQLPCDAAAFEDGTIRCLTFDTLSADIYSDPACSNPIAAQPNTPSCATAAPPTPPRFAFGSPGRLYTLGSLVARTEAYFVNTTAVPPTCERTSPATMYYDLVPADPAMLAPLTTLTE